MEPMEMDDQSVGHAPLPRLNPPSRPSCRPPYALSYTTPSYVSPFRSPGRASGTPSPFLTAPALTFSTPRQLDAAGSFGAERTSALQDWMNSLVTPVRLFARGAVLPERIDSMGDRRETTSPVGESGSMDTSSDRSDVSSMEVGANSPSDSSSWDQVRASLSSFSFSQEPQHGAPADRATKEALQRPEASIVDAGASWEPTLSTVQAAAMLKRRKGRKSPSESPSKLYFELPSEYPRSASCPQLLDTEETDSKPGGEESNVRPEATPEQETAKSAAGSPYCSQRLCVGAVWVLVCVVVAVSAFLLHRQGSQRQEIFTLFDAQLLRNEMNSQVFGQHMAADLVPRSMEQYLQALRDGKDAGGQKNACSLPPLVLSFHGWTGVGKNFVSGIIAGLFAVKTLTRLLVPYHFPHPHLDQVYQQQVQEWILSNVSDYSINFFILDEMDKASVGVAEGIHEAIMKLRQRNTCHSPVILLLLSNSFGTDINKLTFEAMRNGMDRERLSVSHFADIFDSSKGEESWYWRLQSDITVTVPFLPLEKHHVVQCIRRDLVSKKLSTGRELVSRVLQELTFTTLPTGQQFSQTGCKRVSDKVDLVAFNE